jgi:hypothetical protein
MYPYPVISRAYVPGAGADPNTPGKYNFWEAAGLSYYTPRIGPFQLEAGARLGVRLEAAQLNSGGSRINARGLRFGLTAR